MAAAQQLKPEIKIKLTAVAGPHAGQVFQMTKSVITIGRGPENDVVLLNDPQISRTHAQISVVEQDLEVTNLSQKNPIYAQGEAVQKWKIVSNSSFRVGDTELKVEYDLGQSVVSVPAKVVPLKPKIAVPPKKPQAVAAPPAQNRMAVPRPQQAPAAGPGQRMPMPAPGMPMPPGMPNRPQGVPGMPNVPPGTAFRAPPASKAADEKAKKIRMYIIAVAILGGAYFFFSGPDKNAQAKKIASTLKYEDEINIKLNSKKEAELEVEREEKAKIKNSAQKTRVDENFIKGMRDFQLGNYNRAQEFFQLVLNLDPEHALAKRHIQLAKIRFDELVQEKLMLGESYYKKHNFRMCESLYRQVVDMLQGKTTEPKLQLAEKKAKECELADEGIR